MSEVHGRNATRNDGVAPTSERVLALRLRPLGSTGELGTRSGTLFFVRYSDDLVAGLQNWGEVRPGRVIRKVCVGAIPWKDVIAEVWADDRLDDRQSCTT